MLTPEQQTFISTCRAKAAAGTVTLDEMKQFIVILRSSRKSAIDLASSSRESRSTKKAKSTQSTDSMLDDLENF